MRKQLVASAVLGALVLSTSSFVVHAQNGDDAPAVDQSRRLELAEGVLRQREEASGRTFDARYRANMRGDLAARSAEELVALQSGEVIVNNFGDSAADLVYTPVTPCRVFDTRFAVLGILAANTQRNFFVAGAGFANQGGNAAGCGIPFGPATSIVINFAAVNPAGAGNLRAWAVANPQPAAPLAAVLNYSPTLAALANGIAVPICNFAAGGGCASDLRLQADVSAVHVVGDVVGYFARPVNVVTVLHSDADVLALDPDLVPQPVVCATGDITPTLNQRALVHGTTALQVAGPMAYQLRAVVSTDAGVTWAAFVGNRGRGSAGVAGEYAGASKFAPLDLVAGTQYRFGLQIFRDAGTADVTGGRCDTLVEIFPR